jgi:hypothetical protein
MDKLKVKGKFLTVYKEHLEGMKGSIDTSKREAWDSPGANQSHSDTNKFQLSNLALSKSKVEAEYREAITKIELLSVEDQEVVMPGAIFQIMDLDSEEKKTYYLIPTCGGESIEFEGCEITTISANAPIVNFAAGKEEGDGFIFKNKKYEISRIW